MTASTNELVINAKRKIAWHRAQIELLEEWLRTAKILRGSTSSLMKEPAELEKEILPEGFNSLTPSQLLYDVTCLLVDTGQPMTRSEILARLTEAKKTFAGKDKERVLGTSLWRSKRFYNLPKRGYWPKDLAVPPEKKETS